MVIVNNDATKNIFGIKAEGAVTIGGSIDEFKNAVITIEYLA